MLLAPEIAPRPIGDVACALGLEPDELEPHGKYFAARGDDPSVQACRPPENPTHAAAALGRRRKNMASLIWLIVWLVQGTPDLEWFGSWNDWAVALLGCIIFDVFSGREAGHWSARA